MRNSLYSLLFLLIAMLSNTAVFAQNETAVETVMRSNGKIYVVLAVCVTILAGLILYLVSIDRKIAKIEDRQ
jgi:hypothetical protein